MPDDLNLAWRHRASAAAAVLGLAAVAARRPAAVAASAAAMVMLNRSFYALLLRRRGAGQAAAGVGLHAIHHAVGAASIPAGLADAFSRNGERRMSPAGPVRRPPRAAALAASRPRRARATPATGPGTAC